MAQKHSRRFIAALGQIDRERLYSVREAIEVLKTLSSVKFDETIEFSTRLGVDPRKAEENVRGTIVLPHGTGRVLRVAVFAKGDAATEAELAGADVVGGDELIDKIDQGWAEFDVLVAHVDMMRAVGRLGKKLGPRMPNKKSGTVSPDVGDAVRQIKAGKVEYRVDRQSNVNVPIGKVSFDSEKLVENFRALFTAIIQAKPSASKGVYVRHLTLSTTMGPGLKIDIGEARAVLAA
jgi:large subunit ribosomal protein L1